MQRMVSSGTSDTRIILDGHELLHRVNSTRHMCSGEKVRSVAEQLWKTVCRDFLFPMMLSTSTQLGTLVRTSHEKQHKCLSLAGPRCRPKPCMVLFLQLFHEPTLVEETQCWGAHDIFSIMMEEKSCHSNQTTSASLLGNDMHHFHSLGRDRR